MPDELDLVSSFRIDIPGPSTDAWARGRAAIAEAAATDVSRRPRRPRRRFVVRRRLPLAIGALGAASGTAALVSIVVLGGSPAAFAGWTATPAYATADETAATLANCQANLATLGQGSWTELASDVRGPYTMSVYESGSTLATCFAGPSFTTAQAESLTLSQGGMMVSAQGANPPTAPSPHSFEVLSGGAIEQLLVSHLSQAANGVYTLVEGRLESGVSAVTLVLSDGQHVTATTGSGWLVGWWPGSADATAAQITSASGTTTVPLTEVPRPTLPLPPHGGTSGNGTAVPVNGGISPTSSANGGGP